MLLFEADEADHVEDVTGYEAAKVAALLAHRSQFRSTMDIVDAGDAEEIARFETLIVDRLTKTGAEAGFGAGESIKLMTDL